MPSIEYLHNSFSGTYPVPCDILEKRSDSTYLIRFIDPYYSTSEVREVSKSSLVFPKFIDLIVP